MSRLSKHYQRQPFSYFEGVQYVCGRVFYYEGVKYIPGMDVDTSRLRERLARQLWDQKKIEMKPPATATVKPISPPDRDGDQQPGGSLPDGFGLMADGLTIIETATGDTWPSVESFRAERAEAAEREEEAEEEAEEGAEDEAGADAAAEPETAADEAETGAADAIPVFKLPFDKNHEGFGRYYVVDADGKLVVGPFKKDLIDEAVVNATAIANGALNPAPAE